MAEYLIPNYKLEELTKKINRIRNKGAQITFEILENDVSVPAPELGPEVVISCTKIEVGGSYIINGWRFVATIEHSSPENIIRVADTSMSGRIPERYWTAPKDCEHCHIRRDRTDTYLVYNEEHDEWKQVGRTCLQSYTSGLNAETCAEFASVMYEIARLSSRTNEGDFDFDMPGFSSYMSYSMPRVKKLAYKYVAEHGYTSGTTGRAFNDALTNNQLSSEATDEEIQEVTTWLDSAAVGNDWARNARNVWNKSNYELRDAGLITSAVSVYLRNRERELARNARLSDEHNSYAGQVGDKVSFTVRTCVVAYYRSPSNYYASSYPVYRMLGTDGRIYMWGSSAGVEPVEGDVVEGRIKKTSENRNGERVTELTRCKITGHAENSHGVRSIFSLSEELDEDYKTSDMHYEYTGAEKLDERGKPYHGHVATNMRLLEKAFKNQDLVYYGISKPEYEKFALTLAKEDCADANLTTTRSGVVGFAGSKDVNWDDNFTYKIRFKSELLNKEFLSKIFPGSLGQIIFNQYCTTFKCDQFCDVVIIKNDDKKLTSDPSIMTCYPTTLDRALRLMQKCNVYNDSRATANSNIKEQYLILLDPNQKDEVKFRVIKPLTINSSNKTRKSGIDNYTSYTKGAYIDNQGELHQFNTKENVARLKDADGNKYAVSSRVTGDAKDTFKRAAAKEIFNTEKTITDNFRQKYINNLISVWVSDLNDAITFINNEPRLEALIEYVYKVAGSSDYWKYNNIIQNICRDVMHQWNALKIKEGN